MKFAPPDNPAGAFSAVETFDCATNAKLIESVRRLPSQIRLAITDLTEDQLDTFYRNWTIRQITHHIADSHLHSIIRFKWALTEDHPTIKAYEEGNWAQLVDSKSGVAEPALQLLDGLHAKWVQLLQSMTEQQYARTFRHPQSGESVSLWLALNYYAWHGQHHTAQILWLREQNGW